MDRIEREQKRWQDEIYQLLVHRTNDTIDGGGCDSGDPLEFTLAEIRQALSMLEDQALQWVDISDGNSPHGEPVWCWSEDYVDEDFNPSGVREGYWHDDLGWITCGWDSCQDVFTTEGGCNHPAKWAFKVSPKM